MAGIYESVMESAAFLRARGVAADALVILGTGLGGMGARLEAAQPIRYAEIPHFPRSTSPGHAGHLVSGRRGSVRAIVMEGRFHFYEGHPMSAIAHPVRVAKALGATTLLLTSAVGGMSPRLRLGDIACIEDHIHMMGESPLRGPADERLGPRFPDMSAPYDAALMERAEALALARGYRLPRAVLVSVPGPQLETKAEYRLLRAAGADVVGMSSTPEVIAAVQAGMRVCALSVVTDLCLPDALEPADIGRIIATANAAAPRLEQLLLGLLDDGA